MKSRILLGLIAGTIGGFLGWFVQERLINHELALRNGPTLMDSIILALAVGGGCGMLLGAVDGVLENNLQKLFKGLLIGGIAGFLLGNAGFKIGSVVFAMLGGKSNPDMLSFATQIVARAFGWAFLGLGLGVGASVATLNVKRIRNGALGGFIGGFLGGLVFDLVGSSVNILTPGEGVREVGGPGRAIGFTAIGALTGFFIGLVEELLKQAWVKVLAGRNEGKDFILYKPMNILGRDERADIPLYGDMSVGSQHAAIRADGNRHVLLDAGMPLGTIVNGQQVPSGGELLLRDGDMIQIGTHRILFREKATQSRVAPEPRDVVHPKTGPSQVAMPGHICPFCGSPKKADGSCLCSLSAAPLSLPPAAGYSGGGYPGSSGYAAPVPSSSVFPEAAPYPAYGGSNNMPRLIGVEGPYSGQVFLLTAPITVVGRDPDRDIVLTADATISRNHARLVNEGGTFAVYDNGSSNGTFVNSLRIDMQVLRTGDIVQFGSSKFRFE